MKNVRSWAPPAWIKNQKEAQLRSNLQSGEAVLSDCLATCNLGWCYLFVFKLPFRLKKCIQRYIQTTAHFLFPPLVSTLDTFLSKRVLGSPKHTDHFFPRPAEPVIIYCMLFSPRLTLLVGTAHGCWLENKPRERLLLVSFLIILVRNLTVMFSIPACARACACTRGLKAHCRG